MKELGNCMCALFLFGTVFGERHEPPNKVHNIAKRDVVTAHVLTESQRARIIDKHNGFRRNVQPEAANMRELTWNETLENIATLYSRNCLFEHNYGPGMSNYGENLYMTTRTGNAVLDRGVTMWYNEEQHYNYNTGGCSDVCGHYTQVVWANTEQIGCGMTKCDSVDGVNGATVFVCNYLPIGNYQGSKPYENGARCSNCPDGYHCSNEELCSKASNESSPNESTETPSNSNSTEESGNGGVSNQLGNKDIGVIATVIGTFGIIQRFP